MAKKRIDFMTTAFRDGFQSVYGARVLTEDFIPAVEAAVSAGLNHLEVGGGARFQALYFYCNEDAFEMMDAVRKAAGPDANLQTLARGVNVVGLESQSSNIIELHAKLFKKHGITTIRNFDALNDVDNIDYSGRCIVDAGLRHEVCVTLMGLPPGQKSAHDPDFYMNVLKKILDAEIPFHSVCFKDASGTATPNTVYETIAGAHKMLPEGTPLRFHTHETAGTSITCYRAALEAGATALDLSMAPVSGGTGQPDVAVMWNALRGTEYDLGIDIDKVLEAEAVFRECMKDYFFPPESSRVEPMIPFSPMPGGAYTANTQMMRDNNILDRFPEVIKAMEEVVERGGFGTSVTPVSQFYFQQAFNNVFFGPWKKIADGYGRMVLGYFGKTPVPPDAEIVKLSQEQLGLQPTTKSPREINDEDASMGAEAAAKRLEREGLPVTDENIFITATCGEKGIIFLKGEAKLNIRKKKAEGAGSGKRTYTVAIGDRSYAVMLDGAAATIDGRKYSVNVAEGEGGLRIEAAAWGGEARKQRPADAGRRRVDTGTGPALAQPAGPGVRATEAQPSGGSTASARAREGAAEKQEEAAAPSTDSEKRAATSIKAPMPGEIIRINVRTGDPVQHGDVLVIMESMKMETPIKCPRDGVISSVETKQGDFVSSGQIIAWLNY